MTHILVVGLYSKRPSQSNANYHTTLGLIERYDSEILVNMPCVVMNDIAWECVKAVPGLHFISSVFRIHLKDFFCSVMMKVSVHTFILLSSAALTISLLIDSPTLNVTF